MAKILQAGLIVALCSAPVAAQDAPSAWPSEHRDVAAVMSWAAVSTNVAMDSFSAWKQPDRKHAMACTLTRYALTVAAAQITKRLVGRERPDGSDAQSFYSGHTAWAFVSSGWNWRIGIPIGISTGYLRTAANKHYWSDVAAGAGAGLLARKVCRS